MNAKTLTTILLLGFVAASVVVAVVKNVGSGPGAGPADDGLTVYFFHTNIRCPSCETIEAYAHESVHDGFTEQLADGRMHWQEVNYHQSGNEHFAGRYELSGSSYVVVVRMEDGEVVNWKNLIRVWELQGGEKAEFIEYVREEIEAMAGEGEG